MAATLTFAAALAAPALATPAATTVAPVTLPKLPAGWTAWSARPFLLKPHGTHVETTITSWGYRFSAPGPGPGNAVPAGGIMIDISLLRSQANRSHRVNLCSTAPVISGYPRVTLPLTLPKTTTATLEGTPRVKEFRVFGHTGTSTTSRCAPTSTHADQSAQVVGRRAGPQRTSLSELADKTELLSAICAARRLRRCGSSSAVVAIGRVFYWRVGLLAVVGC